MRYSIIIPVYNRPAEIDELLESLTRQVYTNFEVLIIEDGSVIPCDQIVKKYQESLCIKYFYKPNSGPGMTRNYGAEKSAGDYLIFLDSDCIVPEEYLAATDDELKADYVCLFGGPDRASESFTLIQKAINYSMTSIFTTGGIRGGKVRIDQFYPRSFNMGVDVKTFKEAGGFSDMRFGEDIDLSIRILTKGYRSRLFRHSWVYHKRRTDLKKFFKQVINSGIARINLYQRHPKSLKPVHIFPALFTVFMVLLPASIPFFGGYFLIPVLFYFLLIFIDSSIRTKNVLVGLLSPVTSFIQLFAYGSGFIYAFWKVIVLNRSKKALFSDTFYQ
jgi:glycosyltransferase involved in cell wall biosynthesis